MNGKRLFILLSVGLILTTSQFAFSVTNNNKVTIGNWYSAFGFIQGGGKEPFKFAITTTSAEPNDVKNLRHSYLKKDTFDFNKFVLELNSQRLTSTKKLTLTEEDLKRIKTNLDIKIKDSELLEECGLTKVRESDATVRNLTVGGVDKIISKFLGKSLLEFAVDKVTSLFVQRAEKKLTDTLKSYTSTYGASLSPGYFYKKVKPKRVLVGKCFRFVREYEEIIDGKLAEKRKTAMEFIGKMKITDSNSALKIKPLRLAFFKTGTESVNDTIALSVGLKIDSVWVKENISMSEETLNFNFPVANIPAEKNLKDCTEMKDKKEKKACKKSNENAEPQYNYVHYYDKSWQSAKPLKLVPLSDNAKGRAGDVTMTMSVVEAGTPPKYLPKLIKYFEDKKGDIETQLKEALTELLPD